MVYGIWYMVYGKLTINGHMVYTSLTVVGLDCPEVEARKYVRYFVQVSAEVK